MTTPEPNPSLVGRLFAEHRAALQSFFLRRIRSKADAADLAQEVYVRMLRIRDPGAIRNPVSYLYTVANNLVKENAVLDRRQARVDAKRTTAWLHRQIVFDHEPLERVAAEYFRPRVGKMWKRVYHKSLPPLPRLSGGARDVLQRAGRTLGTLRVDKDRRGRMGSASQFALGRKRIQGSTRGTVRHNQNATTPPQLRATGGNPPPNKIRE